MNDLSPEAREMVEAHRRNRTLTLADRKRIKQKVALRATTLAGVTAAAGTAAGMSLASKIVLGTFGLTALIGGGAFSVATLRARVPSHVTSGAPSVPVAARAVAAPELAPPTPVIGGASTSSGAVDRGRHEHPKKLTRRSALATSEIPAPTVAPVAALDPGPELRVLREAREDLRAARPASAYRRLDDFDREHGGGMLAQERSALSAIALCQWHPGVQARTRAAEFLRKSPESPLASRVSSACEKAREPTP
jgi:hypothetical protein